MIPCAENHIAVFYGVIEIFNQRLVVSIGLCQLNHFIMTFCLNGR